MYYKSQKVIVAMSGGVDSSVAAALLKEQGFEVIGVTMSLFCSSKASDKGCCSISAVSDAKMVAEILGIPHYVLNFKEEFKKYVIDNFVEEYKNGRTPNPCIRCNQFMKFGLLLKKARELGASYVATGHYVRVKSEILNSKPGTNSNFKIPKFKLLKGVDNRKEQSYVLYVLNQETLAHTLFPLGEWTKEKVREKAKELGLPVAEKKESQEICFVGEDYGKFLREFIPEAVRPGPILDLDGNVVGMHGGIAFYTIGQRKGVGHHRGKPKYVVEIDPIRNALIIGNEGDTLCGEFIAEDVSFVSGEIPKEPLEVKAKIRYNSPEAKAFVYPEVDKQQNKTRVRVVFVKPQRAVTPGQSVVFYRGEEVVGGGIITQREK